MALPVTPPACMSVTSVNRSQYIFQQSNIALKVNRLNYFRFYNTSGDITNYSWLNQKNLFNKISVGARNFESLYTKVDTKYM